MQGFSIKNVNLVILLTILSFLCSLSVLQAQEGDQKAIYKAKEMTVSRAASPIKVDGSLNDKAWESAAKIDLIYEIYPGENIPAPVKTEAFITFDKSKLYIAYKCYDPNPKAIRGHLMKRDDAAGFGYDDRVGIFIDTFNDERRAFNFVVNVVGVQADGIFSEVTGSADYTWDAIWKSGAKRTDFGYTVEMAIPFTQLRFHAAEDKMTWGISFERSYPRDDATHKLKSHKKDRNINCVLCQVNKVSGFENVRPGRDIEFDPTLTVTRTDGMDLSTAKKMERFPDVEFEKGKFEVEPGLTARWGITPNLTLTGTVNPDFSNVEADAQQLEVNKRFVLQYPEKRLFFLEGLDFFYTPKQIVFTRTVHDPLWGVKLTGKLGKNALGIIATQDRVTSLLFPANQYSFMGSVDQDVFGGVVRYRRDIGNGSTLGFLYTGRMGDGYHNHVIGTDGFLRLNNTTVSRFQLMYSNTDYPDALALKNDLDTNAFEGYAFYASLINRSRDMAYGASYEDLGENFRADFGFLPRVDTRRFYLFTEKTFWADKVRWFEAINMSSSFISVYNHDGVLTDREFALALGHLGPLQGNGGINFRVKKENVDGFEFDMTDWQITYGVTPFKGFSIDFLTEFGDAVDYDNYQLAKTFTWDTLMGVRIGGRLNLDLNHIYQKLTREGRTIFTVNLLQVTLGYHFNVRSFFRAIVQYFDYNTVPAQFLYYTPVDRQKTLFTQLLFSYRLNPQTVLFLGYSDNYLGRDVLRGTGANRALFSTDLTHRNQTFFLKIGYALPL